MKKKVIKILAEFGLFILVIYIYISLCVWQINKMTPPPTITNITAFDKAMNDGTYTYWTFIRNGNTYYEAQKFLPFWTLPSGPSSYVFDDAGTLKDWTHDSGDSPNWNRKWGRPKRSPIGFGAIKSQLKKP